MVLLPYMTLEKMIKKAKPILKKHKIKKASVFGSYARGEQNKKSDFDLLVQTPPKMSLLGLIALENKLKDSLGVDVDLVTYRSVYSRLKSFIKKDEVRIL